MAKIEIQSFFYDLIHCKDKILSTFDEFDEKYPEDERGPLVAGMREIPDDKLKWNEATGHYDFGPIDWVEFWNVVKGNGPCNKERLDTRKAAYKNGKWVRDAAMAYAEKKRKKSAA